ncbi:hypothetical protein V2J09_021386 [Rumex salicifolius]
MALFVLKSDLMKLREGYAHDLQLKNIIEELKLKPNYKRHYSCHHDLLRRKSKLVKDNDLSLRKSILEWLRYSSTSGISRKDVTHHRVNGLFILEGMAKDIEQFFRIMSPSNRVSLLTPLPIPEVVLSKVVCFIPLAHLYSVASIAQDYLDNGVSLYCSIAYNSQSDRQTEVVNKCLVTYLRCMCSDRSHVWSHLLPLVEFGTILHFILLLS